MSRSILRIASQNTTSFFMLRAHCWSYIQPDVSQPLVEHRTATILPFSCRGSVCLNGLYSELSHTISDQCNFMVVLTVTGGTALSLLIVSWDNWTQLLWWLKRPLLLDSLWKYRAAHILLYNKQQLIRIILIMSNLNRTPHWDLDDTPNGRGSSLEIGKYVILKQDSASLLPMSRRACNTGGGKSAGFHFG